LKKNTNIFKKHLLKARSCRYDALLELGNGQMELKIVWDSENEVWEVRQGDTGSLQWSGELRRDAVFYARDREDDPTDAVEKIVAFNRDGTIAWGG
jgi:hypothetical protein